MTTTDTERIRKLYDALRADLCSGVTRGLAAGRFVLAARELIKLAKRIDGKPSSGLGAKADVAAQPCYFSV
jgi:hypothetical protein